MKTPVGKRNAFCSDPIMIETVDRMQAIIYMVSRDIVLYKRPSLLSEHRKVFEAIAHRDATVANQRMKEHLEFDLEFVTNMIE